MEIANPRGEAEGSSPLTRGKLRLLRAPAAAKGLIPAHAGKTWGVCGCVSECGGSSPLTRGKLTAATGQTQDTRLIPAHAGKTRS